MQKAILFSITQDFYQIRPSGTHRVATFLRQNNWDTEVVDWADCWKLDALKKLFELRYDSNLKWIGFGSMFNIWNQTIYDFCDWVKKKYPHIIIISGSSTYSSFKKTTIDYHIKGFGEYALIELLKYLFSNGPRPRFEIGKNTKVIDANSQYPAFPMKSLMVEYEKRDFIQSFEWLSVELSRGCKFQCDFCNSPILGVKGDYSRDAEDFEYQMKSMYEKFGIKKYYITDETFNDRTEKITKFANVVEQLNFKPLFSGFLRADLLISRPLDREELLRMNFIGHYYGVESFNHKSAKSIGKGMNTERLKDGILEIKNYFKSKGSFRGTISLIVGLPHETLETLKQNEKWLIDNWNDQNIRTVPLHIYKNEFDKPSKMSLDYKSYGYQEMTKEEILKYVKTEEEYKNLNSEHLIWKNDNMNFFQAHNYKDEFQEKTIKNNFNLIGNWDMHLEGQVKFINYTTISDSSTFELKFLNYVNNKLNI
jgi:radical SAM superfamily enzyme YgiQ (UPF0313 family)